jgi:hypothetical protein
MSVIFRWWVSLLWRTRLACDCFFDKSGNTRAAYATIAFKLNRYLRFIVDRAMKSFSELTGKEKSIECLRWICVPPAAVLASLAPRIVASLVMSPVVALLPGTPAMPASDFSRYFLHRIFTVVMGAAFVIAGARTAPRYRFATAAVLAVGWVAYSLASHVLVHLGRGTPHYTDFVIAAVAAAGGAAYIFHSEKSKGSRPVAPRQES